MGDLVIPAGTKLSWRFNTKNAEALSFNMGDSSYQVKRTGDKDFFFSKSFFQECVFVSVFSMQES